MGLAERFLTTEAVLERIRLALATHRGLSLVRIGDAETRTLIYTPYNLDPETRDIINYSGVESPTEEVKARLRAAVAAADLVGLRPDYDWTLGPARLDVTHKDLCSAYICFYLHQKGGGPLYPLIRPYRILLVGRQAAAAMVPARQRLGLNIVGSFNLEGMAEVDTVFHAIKRGPAFDLALVSAGIPAVVLCPRLARELAKVAIDFGHAMDDIITPGFDQNVLEYVVMPRWRAQRRLAQTSPPPPDNLAAAYEGTLVQGSNPAVYLIQGGVRRHIPNEGFFCQMGWRWEDIRILPDGWLAQIPLGPPL